MDTHTTILLSCESPRMSRNRQSRSSFVELALIVIAGLVALFENRCSDDGGHMRPSYAMVSTATKH